MKLVLRRQLAALVTISVLSLAAVGCANVRAQTQEWYEPADGVSTDTGDIAIRNVLLVADEEGEVATLFATFANEGAPMSSSRYVSATASRRPRAARWKFPRTDTPNWVPTTSASMSSAPTHDRVSSSTSSSCSRRLHGPRCKALVQRAEGDYATALDDIEEPTPTPF